MNTTEKRSSSILNTLRESVALRVAAGIGSAALLTGCASSTEASAPAEQPSASQPASEAPTPVETVAPVEKFDTPEVDHSDTGISSIPEAVALLSTGSPIDINSATPDFQALVNAANGDVSDLNALGVTINDIVANHELDKLLIEEFDSLLPGLEDELPAWKAAYGEDYSLLNVYDDARATKYLTGTIIDAYASGAITLDAADTVCPTDENMDVVLGNGVAGSKIIPPLSPIRFSYTTETCALSPLTATALESIRSSSTTAAGIAGDRGLLANQKAFQVMSAVESLDSPDAQAIIKKYSS